MGARYGPQTPNVRRAPAEPWRASITRVGIGGPDMAPKTPNERGAPAEPWRSSITRMGIGGPDMAPKPPTFVAPRRSRGAPRSRAWASGAPIWPQNSQRSSRPGGGVALLDHAR